jgi:putative transposase
MPRQGRLHIAGTYYHVFGRALERRDIFKSDIDKTDFLDRLARGLLRTSIQCMAWTVMSNHYHLLLRSSDAPLARLMSGLLGGYASQYNRREHRVGYVFQSRFSSILCEAETYFLSLVRYIHLNPIHAGLVADIEPLDSYRWTGHCALVGNRDCTWQNTREVLSHFGSKPAAARQGYRSYVNAGQSDPKRPDFDGGGLIRSAGGWEALSLSAESRETRASDERILGGSEFVESTLAHDEIEITSAAILARDGLTLTTLTELVCNYFHVDPSAITIKGRSNSRANARSVLCYLGNRNLGISQRELAAALTMSQSGVACACNRGRRYCSENDLALSDFSR